MTSHQNGLRMYEELKLETQQLLKVLRIRVVTLVLGT